MKKESFLKRLGKNLLKWSPLLLLGLGGAWILSTEIPIIATGVENVIATVASWGAEGGILEKISLGLLEPITAKILGIGSAALYGLGVIWGTLSGSKTPETEMVTANTTTGKRALTRQQTLEPVAERAMAVNTRSKKKTAKENNPELVA